MRWRGRRESSNVEDRRGIGGRTVAIGDDRLQKEAQGYVVPESFTHGSSAPRMRWFKRGWDTGNLRQGDTFSVANP
jgi:uncharacterized protein